MKHTHTHKKDSNFHFNVAASKTLSKVQKKEKRKKYDSHVVKVYLRIFHLTSLPNDAAKQNKTKNLKIPPQKWYFALLFFYFHRPHTAKVTFRHAGVVSSKHSPFFSTLCPVSTQSMVLVFICCSFFLNFYVFTPPHCCLSLCLWMKPPYQTFKQVFKLAIR